MTTLTAYELEDLASRAFGPGWQSALARDRGVAIRTVQRWAKDGITKPETAQAILDYLRTRTVISLPSKPEAGPHKEIIRTAMAGIVSEITQAGVAVGWTEQETRTAMQLAITPKRTRSKRFEPRPPKPFVYEPATDPFLIEGERWRVGADFNFVPLRVADRSLRLTPMTDEQRSRAIAQIRERADEIAAHSLRSAAYVVGLLMMEEETDGVATLAQIGELMDRAKTDEERASVQRILEGRATQADREAAMKCMETGR